MTTGAARGLSVTRMYCGFVPANHLPVSGRLHIQLGGYSGETMAWSAAVSVSCAQIMFATGSKCVVAGVRVLEQEASRRADSPLKVAVWGFSHSAG